MEFNFDVSSILPARINKISLNCRFYSNGRYGENPLRTVIDTLGAASAKAQGLGHPITSFAKQQSSDHTLYIMKDENNTVVGLIKVGQKNLFVLDKDGNQNELRPLCVLDFYVHESKQRQGYGKELFEHVLREFNVDPRQLAIDRPSHKFQGFLAKHYNMKHQIPQMNNFVIYHGFFDGRRDIIRHWNTNPLSDQYKRRHTAFPGSLSSRSVLPDIPKQPYGSGSNPILPRPLSHNVRLGNENAFHDSSQPTLYNHSPLRGGIPSGLPPRGSNYSRHAYERSQQARVQEQSPTKDFSVNSRPSSGRNSRIAALGSNEEQYNTITANISSALPGSMHEESMQSRYDKSSLNAAAAPFPLNSINRRPPSPLATNNHQSNWTVGTNSGRRGANMSNVPSSWNIFGTMPSAYQPQPQSNAAFRTRLW